MQKNSSRDYRGLQDDDKASSSSAGIGTCVAVAAATCCGCFCCSFAVFIIILLLLSGPTGWYILIGCTVVFVIVFAVIFVLHQTVIEGTAFNLFNYHLPFAFKYGLISQFKGEQGVKDMWKSMEGETPFVADGFGPNTITYFGWEEAKDALSNFGPRIRDGTLKRHNELGTAILGPAPWPETGKIALGYDNEDHRVARPYIGRAIDGSRVPEGPCDGSNGWNRRYLRQAWRERFDSVDTFNTADVMWWCTVILHKIHCNWDLSDDEAQEFSNFPSCLSFPGSGKVGVGMGNITDREYCFIKCLPPIPCWQVKIQDHVDTLKEYIQAKWPNDDWEEEKLKLVANMFMDSLMYAGGLSVPTIMTNMLAWWFSSDRPGDLDKVSGEDEDSVKDFMWETMRRNPPVAGVPSWVTYDDGETWSHEIANVEQAMQDERVFEDPMSFKLGRPGLNAKDSSRSMCWADFAIMDNDTCNGDSHNCPGKDLTQEMVVTFFQEFISRAWTTDQTNISVGYNLTTTFDLTQQ